MNRKQRQYLAAVRAIEKAQDAIAKIEDADIPREKFNRQLGEMAFTYAVSAISEEVAH